jgi:hypothetical protein
VSAVRPSASQEDGTSAPGVPTEGPGPDSQKAERGREESAGLREGWRLYARGELDEARRLMMPEAARSPDDPEPAYLLGMIFKAQGERDHAVRAFAAVTRTVGNVSDPIRSAMIRRLAQANLELLGAESPPVGGKSL